MLYKNDYQLYVLMEVSTMEFEVKEHVSIPDGVHQGVVKEVRYRVDPYQYTDIYLELNTGSTTAVVKWGAPSTVSEKSKLGKLLSQFVELVAGSTVDPEKLLIGKQVSFQTLTVPGRDGNDYSVVVDGSIKPLVKGEPV